MDKCNVCNSKIYFTSKKNFIEASKNYNWVNDSTIALTGLDDSIVYQGYCKNCLQTSIFPRFDTNKLYEGNLGFEARRKAYEFHHPKSKYEKNRNLDYSKENVQRINREFLRISNITNTIIRISKDFDNLEKKTLSILDYGGGDGYLVKVIKEILESKTNFNFNFKIQISLYDPAYENSMIKTKPDIIIISHVLEHIHDLKKFFKDLNDISKKSTHFLIEVPDERLKILRTLIFRSKVYFNFHVNIFTVTSLATLFNIHGYNSNFKYKETFYRGVRANVINGIASKRIKKFNSSIAYEITSFLKLILSKIKIKFFNTLS